MTVVYACGCVGEEVGQAFEGKGLLVCPIHHEPTAPYERDTPPYRGVVRLEIEIEAPDQTQAARWVDTLSETLTLDDKVRNLSVVSEQK